MIGDRCHDLNAAFKSWKIETTLFVVAFYEMGKEVFLMPPCLGYMRWWSCSETKTLSEEDQDSAAISNHME